MLSRISEFLKKKKAARDEKKNEKTISVFAFFRYSDKFDKILIAIGTISAIISASVYPLLFFVYGSVADALIDYVKDTEQNSTSYQNGSNSSSVYLCPSKKTYDTNSRGQLSLIVQLYIAFGLISLFFGYASHVCWNTAAERQIRRIKHLLFKSILKQEVAFFDRTKTAELSSLITRKLPMFQNTINFRFSDTILMFARGIGCILLGMIVAWKFGIVFLAMVPLTASFTAAVITFTKRYTAQESKAYENSGEVANETFSNIRTVFSFSMQKKLIKKYDESMVILQSLGIRKGLMLGIFNALTMFSLNAYYAVGIAYGIFLYRTDCETYTGGTIMQSLLSVMTGTFSFGLGAPFFKDVSETKEAVKDIYNVLEKESLIDASKDNGIKLDQLNGHIQFDNICFGYPQRPENLILKNFNLEIPAGKTVALCGSTGSGKSTIIQLLQRFYDPLSGNIKIDGQNVNNLNLNWFRNQISLVSQEPVLFATTIKENIRLGNLDATDQEIEAAAKLANAHSFIADLKDKYETFVGERGSKLSGGQKQRIALARALLRNPRILLLDEATSALDLESEKIVQEALDEAKKGRTTIIVAHRLNTIRNADIIFCISNGKIVESGTHEELMQAKGFYYDLNEKNTKKLHSEHDYDESSSNGLLETDDLDIDVSIKDVKNVSSPIKSVPKRRLSKINVKRFSSLKKQIESIYISQDEAEEKKPCSFLKWERALWPMHKPETLSILIGMFGQAINGVSYPLVLFVFMQIFDLFLLNDSNLQRKKSLEYMGAILAIAFVGLLAIVVQSFFSTSAGVKVVNRIRLKMFETIIRQEIGWHELEENHSSNLSVRLENASLCKNLIIDRFGIMVQGLSGLGCATIICFVLSWKLAFVLIVFIPILVFSAYISAQSNTLPKKKDENYLEKDTKLITECIENIRTVVSLGRESYFIDQFEMAYAKTLRRVLINFHIHAFFYAVSLSILFFVQAATFGYGFKLIKNKEAKVSDIYRMYGSIIFSTTILGRIFSQLQDTQDTKDAAEVIHKIISRTPLIDSMSEEGKKIENLKGEIKFHNVSFRYPTRNKKVLNEFDLTVEPNQTTAIVGKSGSGKSTIVQLLLRFYDVNKGKITIDEIDIRDLNLNWWRSQIGLVSQEPVLFNCTIMENIKYGDGSCDEVSLERIVEAATISNIIHTIEKMPKKFDTVVGAKGSQLSGGEKQRIAIARALIRKPKILLLDEATSALDASTEELVQNLLDAAQNGRTCICIAHRLATIENASKIVVLNEGSVLEQGTHRDLMENRKLYHALQIQNESNNT